MAKPLNNNVARALLAYAGLRVSATIPLYETAASLAERLLGKQRGELSAQTFVKKNRAALNKWLLSHGVVVSTLSARDRSCINKQL